MHTALHVCLHVHCIQSLQCHTLPIEANHLERDSPYQPTEVKSKALKVLRYAVCGIVPVRDLASLFQHVFNTLGLQAGLVFPMRTRAFCSVPLFS